MQSMKRSRPRQADFMLNSGERAVQRRRRTDRTERTDKHLNLIENTSADMHDRLLQPFKEIRQTWTSNVQTTTAKLERCKKVLSDEYGIELDGNLRDVGSQRKRLKVAEQRSSRAKEQLAALENDLDQNLHKLEEERSLRQQAKENQSNLKSQLDIIRELLNPRQRKSLGDMLHPRMTGQDLHGASPSSPTSISKSPRSILKKTPQTQPKVVQESGLQHTNHSSNSNRYAIYPDLDMVDEPVDSHDSKANDTCCHSREEDPSFLATSCFSGAAKTADSTDCGADYRAPLQESQQNEYMAIPSIGLMSPSATAPPLPDESESPPSYSQSVEPFASPRSAMSPSTPKTPKSAPRTPMSTAKSPRVLSRCRRHFVKHGVKDNVRHKCKYCFEWIRIRQKHIKCTQCGLRFHEDCLSTLPATCQPPPFGTKSASDREAPPLGSNLQASVKTYSMDVEADLRIPGVVYDCIQTIQRRGVGVEALYCKDAITPTAKSLLEKYFLYPAGDNANGSSGPRRPNLQVVVDLHEVTGVLRLFLRQLDEPVTSFAAYPELLDAAMIPGTSTKNERLCKTISEIPATFFFTLHAVRNHLSWVVKNSPCEMDEEKLARIFAPSLLRSPEGDVADTKDIDKQIMVVKSLIEMPDEYWVTAEAEVTNHGYCPSASPVPQKKELKRQKSSSKALRGLDSPAVA